MKKDDSAEASELRTCVSPRLMCVACEVVEVGVFSPLCQSCSAMGYFAITQERSHTAVQEETESSGSEKNA